MATSEQHYVDLVRRFSLKGRAALIVGGSRGIGRAIAEAFADAGADVAVVGRSSGPLEQTAAAIERRGVRGVALTADVSDESGRKQLVADAHARLGRLDILVNSAGAKPVRGDMLDRERDELPELLQTNVLAYHQVSLAAARIMKAQGWGRIINISSATGQKARRGMAEYAITKAAEIMMTRAFAVELGEYGITVNALAPILTRTEFSAAQLADESDVQRVLAMQAIKRIAEPEDVVGSALLLASDAGAFITGTTITIDGGAAA
ncbi:SDR family NAD(P)-dependent oxidoreductase [Pusillimonas sp.]|uniref:SDR family NAD(P)-dependent oxidoreductase n=1 Tax=Pusillimonas sp. TaxID=3040095 RepID=UPI0037CC6932